MRIIEEDMLSGRDLVGDCFWISSHVPVWSAEARSVLEPLIATDVEFVELPVGGTTAHAVNVLRIVDCIDYDKAEVERYKSSGRLMRFRRYAFVERRLADIHIFKIPEKPTGYVFVSDEFVRLAQSRLTGFRFKDATFAGSLRSDGKP